MLLAGNSAGLSRSPSPEALGPRELRGDCAAGPAAQGASQGAHRFLLSPQRCRSVTADFIV